MKLTPLDIKRHQFEKGFRGYDPDEVDGFLKQVADQHEALLEELRLAHERTREVEGKLQHYERVELALQEALESAKTSARRTEEDATRRAALVVEEAELRAQQILQDVERERFGMKQDLIKLSARQAEVAARLRGFLMSELQVVADFQGGDRHGLLRLDASPDRLLDTPGAEGQALADFDPAGSLGAPEQDTPQPDAPDAEAPGQGTDEETPGPEAWTEPLESEPSGTQASDAQRAETEPFDTDEPADVGDARWSDLDAEARPPEAPGHAEIADVSRAEPDGSAPETQRWGRAEPEPYEDAETSERVRVSSRTHIEDEPLAPGESGVVGEATPVEPVRRPAPPVMPADPWTIPEPNVAGSDAERERIRRILEDLD